MTTALGFGPNTPLVEGVLARSRRLTDAEGMALLDANRRMLVTDPWLSVALRDVVYAAYRSDREVAMDRALRAGRNSIRLFDRTRRQAALGGIIGRLCEALVVLELLPLDSRELMLAPWRSVIDAGIGKDVPSPFGG
jgi:hypothetical protein